MILLILSIIFFALYILLFDVTEVESIIFMFVAILFIVPLLLGTFTYPSLVSMREEVLALKSEIETVRSAYYPQSNVGTFIGGSLDNMQQSKELSVYIINYSQKKSQYNKALACVKTRLKIKLYWWLGDTLFMSKDILKMEEL